MTSSSEPQKKDGLRCDCGKLLLERDSETGELGVRCGRREHGKFWTLEEINRRAAELQKENRRKEMEFDGFRKRTVINQKGGSILWSIEGELLPLQKGDTIKSPQEVSRGLMYQRYKVKETTDDCVIYSEEVVITRTVWVKDLGLD